MNGAKHTPGPWHVVTGDGHDRRVMAANDPGPVAIAFRPSEATLASEAQANAQLIAAAPDLLEALDTLTVVLGLTAIKHAHQMPPLQEAWNMARAAIKKARGES